MSDKDEEALKAQDERINEGIKLLIQGRHQEALDAFNKAISLKPDNPEARLGKGFALSSLGKHQDAVDAFDKAISLKPDDPIFAWGGKGIALFRLDKYQAALDAFDKAISLKPDDPETWNIKSIVLLKLKRDKEALAAVEKAISLNSKLHEAHDTRGTVLFHMKKWGQSVAAYDQAIDRKGDEPLYWYNRGLALSHLGRREEAEAAWKHALDLDPRFAEAGQALQAMRGEGISWWDWWLVIGGWRRRAPALFLMLLFAAYLVFPLFQENLSWVLNLGKPWHYYIVPVAAILFLLILPSIRRLFAVGGAGVEMQPLTPLPQPDLKPMLEMAKKLPKEP